MRFSGGDDASCLKHVEFKVPMGPPQRDVQETSGFRDLELKRKFEPGDRDLGGSPCMPVKATRMCVVSEERFSDGTLGSGQGQATNTIMKRELWGLPLCGPWGLAQNPPQRLVG